MSSSANVRSIQALEELRNALMRFKTEAQSAVNSVEGEVKRTRAWLQERLNYWQNELRRRRRRLGEAQAALIACEALAALDCSPLQAAVMREKQLVQEAEQELRVVQQYIKKVEEAVASYQHQARQLAVTLDNNLLKGSELLSRSVTILLSYASGSVGMSPGGSSIDTSYVNGSGRDSLPGGASAGTDNIRRDPIYINCPQCDGSGNEDIECNPCGGRGYRFDGSKCPHCKGLGMKSIKCLRCEGTGTVLEEISETG